MKLPKLGLNTLFAKIIFQTLISLILTVFILLYYQNYQQDKVEKKLSEEKLLSDAQFQANHLVNKLNPAYQASATLANVFAAATLDSISQINRKQINALLRNIIEQNPAIVGVGAAWEPDAFDSRDYQYKNAPGHDLTGIFIPHWYYNENDSLIQRPYSNYYVEPFYIQPKENLKPAVIGPSRQPGMNKDQWHITFSHPIVKKGQFLGVAFTQANLKLLTNTVSTLDADMPNSQLSIYSWNGDILYNSNQPQLAGQEGSKLLTNFQKQIRNIKNARSGVYSTRKGTEAWVPVTFEDASTRWQLRSSFTGSIYSRESQKGIIALLILLIVLVAIGEFLLLRQVLKPLKLFTINSTYIATGNTNIEKDFPTSTKEFKTQRNAFNAVVNYLQDLSNFADELGRENFDVEYKPRSKKDILGHSLLKLKDSLKTARSQEAERQREEQKRNWINEGLARFNEILHRRYEEQSEMSYIIIKEILNYIGAIQGGLFIYKTEDEEKEKDEQHGYLELMAAVAYDERKYMKKQLQLGEELTGACALEQKTIYMTDLPEDYVYVTSGLGGATPNNLILVPLTIKDRVYGVIELASFEKIPTYKREFLEKLAESLATTLYSSQINERTARLLEKSKQQAEEMATQEEEMRQNLEELQATQEDLNKKQKDLHAIEQIINIAFHKIVLNQYAVIQEVNDNFLKTIGYDRQEMIEADYRKILDKTKLNEFEAIWKSVLQGNDYHGQVRWIAHNGKEAWSLVTYMPVMNEQENVEKVFCISYDITRSKELESRLQHIEEALSGEREKSKGQQGEIDRLQGEYSAELKEQKRINKQLRDEIKRYKDQNE